MNADEKKGELRRIARLSVSCLAVTFLSSAFFSENKIEKTTLWAKEEFIQTSAVTEIVPDIAPKGSINNPVNEPVIEPEKPSSGFIFDEKEMPDRYVIIPKKNKENDLATLTDEYLYRTVHIDIKNSDKDFYNPDIIQRFVKNKKFQGKPENRVLPPYMMAFLNGGLTQEMIDIYDEFSTNNKENKTDGDTLVHFKSTETKLGNTRLSLTFDRVYVPEFLEDDNNYYILLRRPKDIYKKILVVDIGHGGTDVGTCSGDNKVFEKDITLQFGLLLKKFLERQSDIKVYFTRVSDVTVYRRPRADLANELEADFFLSIHSNNYTVKGTPLHFSGVSGSEVHYNGKKTRGNITSRRFAGLILEATCSTLKLRNRGLVEGSKFVVLGHTTMPSALLELGFLTNKNDLAVLQDKEKMKECAKAVYKAIVKAFEENKNVR